MMSPFFEFLKIDLFNVSFETKNLLIFPLNFSRVKHTPEHEIDDPKSFFLNLIFEYISNKQLFFFSSNFIYFSSIFNDTIKHYLIL